MLKIKDFENVWKLVDYIRELDKEKIYFLWEFLQEIDSENDEFMILLEQWEDTILLKSVQSNQEKIPSLYKLFYASHLFENEIYDFYWKPTEWIQNYILRLHLFDKNYFPKRKLWKPIIKDKIDYIFTDVKWEWLTAVPVWPIHAWIIPPGHFRFTVDWEDTINLDIKLWWKYRGVESYFTKEKDLQKLLLAAQEIAGDSAVVTSWGFAQNIEDASNVVVDDETLLNRILLLELERIYNHLWTVWALANDVWQWFLLNWCLSIREKILELNEEIFWTRVLKWIVNIWYNSKYITKQESLKLLEVLEIVESRFKDITTIEEFSPWIYDRFKDTWIVTKDIALAHSALWVSAKASWINRDNRQFDKYYLKFGIRLDINLWLQWDSYDRFIVRAREIFQSIDIIRRISTKLKFVTKNKSNLHNISLKDWYYVSRIEWHRWENMQMICIKNQEIVYYKFKDPSFVNWTLLEYAVLNNIIADFPICNKSFDLSYSWFDV